MTPYTITSTNSALLCAVNVPLRMRVAEVSLQSGLISIMNDNTHTHTHKK